MTIDFCKQCDCGSKKPIVNRTHWLCQEKNRERLDNQKTVKTNKHKLLTKQALKQKERVLDLKKVYEEIAEEREQICEGCRNTHVITHSHTIPKSRRKDLELQKKNIVYLCMKCHTKWEHGTLEDKNTLLNFNEMIEYIKENDNEFYNLLIAKWQE